MVPQIQSIDKLSGLCSQAITTEGEIRSDIGPSAAAPAKLTTPAIHEAKAEAPKAEANIEVVCDISTSHEAHVADEVDVVRAEACDDDLPSTSTPVASDVEEEDDDDDDDEEGDSPDLPDSSSDLDDDDEDDDKDDFTIQYQRPSTATKKVALKDSAS
ncbi:nonsense-mediated mRNA decay protein 2-like [Cynara cardunculus var. scolymus]|uniref:nonsense-mediated mRNA decay protein 2-like n=1 Tax=Cynara cardunculus var. scolymus TaxID=59895 RepID=UPI000D625F7E|nr:nonsense-mediated mRNA decay protein 2-like [Cynara cardunculus var. scolymus]